MLSVADAVQPVRQRGNDMRLAAAGGSVDQARIKRTAQPLLRRVDGLLLVGAEFGHRGDSPCSKRAERAIFAAFKV